MSRPVRMSRPVVVLLAMAVVVCLAALKIASFWFSPRPVAETSASVYVLSGDPKAPSDKPLFRLLRRAGGLLEIEKGEQDASLRDGGEWKWLAPGATDRVVIGRYIWDAKWSGQGEERGTFSLTLAGVALERGDETGWAPGMLREGRPMFSGRQFLGAFPGFSRGATFPLWLNGLPTSAIRLVTSPEARSRGCKEPCVEIGPTTLPVTLERRDPTLPVGTRASFDELIGGDFRNLGPADVLWFGHLAFQLTESPDQAGRYFFELKRAAPPRPATTGAPLRADAAFDRYRGRRRDWVGSPGFTQRAVIGEKQESIDVYEIRTLFKGKEVPAERWSQQTEDELGLLIDQGLLCVTLSDRGSVGVVPQLTWGDLSSPGCTTPFASSAPMRQRPHLEGLPGAVLTAYARRRASSQLIVAANESLVRGDHLVNPESFPFVFEWWLARDEAASADGPFEVFPTTLWGVRSQATNATLDLAAVRAGIRGGDGKPTRRPANVVIKGAGGRVVPLAWQEGPTRRYASGVDLAGLGPLLGWQGLVTGLDDLSYVLDAGKKGGKGREELTLTVDPDLQAALWATLRKTLEEKRRQLLKRTSEGPPPGVSVVVLDASDGSVKAVLNWPEAVEWETPGRERRLASTGLDYRPIESKNRAMMRSAKVGSTMKILTAYAMAAAGKLDAGPVRNDLPAHPLRAGKPKHSFTALETGADGRLRGLAGAGSSFGDDQPGSVPTGPRGLAAGLADATGESCNTYFAVAATMLLGKSVPLLGGTPGGLGACPVDSKRRLTGGVTLGPDSWLACQTPGNSGSTTTLLVGRNDLIERVSDSMAPGGASWGWFRRALDAGYRFLFKNPVLPGNRTGSALKGYGFAGYEGVAYRQDWFDEGWISRTGESAQPGAAIGRVFRYPAMSSPKSFFGGGKERYSQKPGQADTEEDVAGLESWRDFGAQAIGEAGEGSALSLAVLYSALAREDGRLVAPRLKASSPVDPTRWPKAFDPSPARLEALREAFHRPVQPGGTAYSSLRSAPYLGSLLGKTGTFGYYQLVPDEGDDNSLECGVALRRGAALLQPAGWGSLLGTRGCEESWLVGTAIHRYPDEEPEAPEVSDEKMGMGSHTSFVGVLGNPANGTSGSGPLVLAIVVDEPKGGATASGLAKDLLKECWEWMRGAP